MALVPVTSAKSPRTIENVDGEKALVIPKEVNTKKAPPKQWEDEIRILCSSEKWLKTFGLKKNRLNIGNVLPALGFRHATDYDIGVRKPVCSKYADGMFQRFYRSSDGAVFNLTCSQEKLRQIELRLQQAIELYQQRLRWLTSESRQIFGVIEDASIAVILDICTLSPKQYEMFQCAFERVLLEQVFEQQKFNIVHAADHPTAFQSQTSLVPITPDSIQNAVDWVWAIDRLSPYSNTAVTEALNMALDMTDADCIYLFTEGCSCSGAREILFERVRNSDKQIHVVSYQCFDSYHLKFLKDLTVIKGSKFHAYSVVKELPSYDAVPVNDDFKHSNVEVGQKIFGGVPDGAGRRSDVTRLFDEIEDAKNVLSQIQALMLESSNVVYDPKKLLSKSSELEKRGKEEQYLTSKEWLAKYGLNARGLNLWKILATCSFKHCNTVVDIPVPDGDPEPKLIEAQYCNKFVHLLWKDRRVVHVYATVKVVQDYETQMHATLEAIQKRINWLKQGSRELFGTLAEDNLYFLIDTSSSMQNHIEFVKDKFFNLMQEQLRHKKRFNIVTFDSSIHQLRDRLVEITENSLREAWTWVQNIKCEGSTNTLDALHFALSDNLTEAIYLLSDGRPDHPPETILSQVSLRRPVPIHAISFNCNDKEGNQFLFDLAHQSGGRFHYYSDLDTAAEPGPQSWESEDVKLLRSEIEKGLLYVSRLQEIGDQCRKLVWHPQITLPAHHPRATSAHGRLEDRGRNNRFLPHSRKSYEIQSSRVPMGDGEYSRRQKQSKANRIDKAIQELAKSAPNSPRRLRRHKRRPKSVETTKSWFSRNNLEAMKLTIDQLLHPVMVPHRWKYVPIIDKRISAKVFSDVLPVAHITDKHSSGINDINLFNPLMVDFATYESKLESAIKLYQQRLHLIARRKAKLLARSSEKTNHQTEKGEGEEDIVSPRELEVQETEIETALKVEISKAEKFIEQSQQLRTVVDDMRAKSKQKSVANIPPAETETKRKRPIDTLKGESVIARSDKDGFYYSGHVVKCFNKTHCLVHFEFINSGVVQIRHVIPISGAVPRPSLRLGDHVLGKVRLPEFIHCYVPGVIEMTPTDHRARNKFFTVRTFNGTQATLLRSHIVKIGKQTFANSIRYINLVNQTHEPGASSSEESTGPTEPPEIIEPGGGEDESEGDATVTDESERDEPEPPVDDDRKMVLLEQLEKQMETIQEIGDDLKQRIEEQNMNQSEMISEAKMLRRIAKQLKGKTPSKLSTTRGAKPRSPTSVSLSPFSNGTLTPNSLSSFSHEETVTKSQADSVDGAARPDSPPSIQRATTPPKVQSGRTSPSSSEDQIRWQTVFVRNEDNGLFSKCQLLSSKTNTHKVKYKSGRISEVGKQNVIFRIDVKRLKNGDPVLAMHPHYVDTYAPGAVLETSSKAGTLIRFYDNLEKWMKDVHKILEREFEEIVAMVARCERDLIGKTVIAKDDLNGLYRKGKVKSVTGVGGKFQVELDNGQVTLNGRPRIFQLDPDFDEHDIFQVGDKLMAPGDKKHSAFLPAIVTKVVDRLLTVRFVDGRTDEVSAMQCYRLSEEIYEESYARFNKTDMAEDEEDDDEDESSSEDGESDSFW